MQTTCIDKPLPEVIVPGADELISWLRAVAPGAMLGSECRMVLGHASAADATPSTRTCREVVLQLVYNNRHDQDVHLGRIVPLDTSSVVATSGSDPDALLHPDCPLPVGLFWGRWGSMPFYSALQSLTVPD